MRWLTKKWVKYTLAGVGAVYAVLFVVFIAYGTFVQTPIPSGPSELEAHPERQDEIQARQRADEMRQRLGLNEEQTEKIAEIMQANQPGPGGGRERWQSTQEQIAQVLTPEQRAQAEQMREQMRNQFAGRGGPPPFMDPQRVESLKQKMTPDQRQRFEKALQQWEQRRQQRGGRRGGQGRQ